MIKLSKKAVLFNTAALLAILTAHTSYSEPTDKEESRSHINQASILVGLPEGNPPWFHRDETTQKMKGHELWIQKQLFANMEVIPKLKPYENIVRLAAEIVKGKVDAGPVIYSKGKTPLTSPNISCTKSPYGDSKAYLYAVQNSELQATNKLSDLKEKNISFTRIINIHKLFPEFPKHHITSHRTPNQALKMLMSGRSQLILSTPETTTFWRKHNQLELKPIYKVGEFQVHLCFSHASLGEKLATSYAHKTNINAERLLKKINRNKKGP